MEMPEQTVKIEMNTDQNSGDKGVILSQKFKHG